ncbi:hypothetical protein ES708_11633 [subsurface metagenome]
MPALPISRSPNVEAPGEVVRSLPRLIVFPAESERKLPMVRVEFNVEAPRAAVMAKLMLEEKLPDPERLTLPSTTRLRDRASVRDPPETGPEIVRASIVLFPPIELQVPLVMVTVSPLPGTPIGVQFVAVPQSPTPPFQV